MSALSDYAENKLLDHICGIAEFAMPSEVYLALFTSPTSDASPGTEVSGNGYERQKVTFGSASNGTITNAQDVLFPKATGTWGTVTHAALFDAVTGGNMLWHGALQQSKTIETDDEFKLEAGKLTLTID